MSYIDKIKLPGDLNYDIKDSAAVSTEVQELTSAQKTQARTNIDALTAVENGTIVPTPITNLEVELKKRPEVIIRKIFDLDNEEFIKYIYVSHPLQDYPGAELVLMHYAKKNCKALLEGSTTYHNAKKGFCVAVGKLSQRDYFSFTPGTSEIQPLLNYINSRYGRPATEDHNYTGIFGVALRIPNPEYTGPTTMHRNAIYRGVPESLWSDVQKLLYSEHKELNKPMGSGVGTI